MDEFNVGLLGVSPDNMNKGCEALLFSQLVIIRKLETKERKINVFMLYGQEPSRKVNYKIMGVDYEVTILPIPSKASLLSLLKTFRNLKSIRKIRKLDYVFAIGYGDSFSDIYGLSRFHSINDPIKYCYRKGIKVVLMPQTIGPFRDNTAKRQAFDTIQHSFWAYPRDKESRKYIEANTNEHRLTELIDMAFFLPYQKRIEKNGKINVGIAISGLLWRNGYTGNNEFGLKTNYSLLIQDIISALLSFDNVIIHLTPHVVNGSCLCDDDYSLSYSIQQGMASERVVLSPFFKDPIMAKNYISGLDFFIGSRMHACIAAYSAGVPTVPISYSRKFTGLFTETLNYPFIADPTAVNHQQILDQVLYAFNNRKKLKRIVDESLEGTVKERKSLLINELSALFQ